MKVVIEADGGSRGNPGPAGYGAVVWTPDRGTVLAENKQAIGRATNNVAEYRGLIAGLDDALKLGATEAEVYLDSKLLVEQMSGRWKVKHPDLIELHAQARGLAARFDRISYSWIPRERNSHADRLANEAMDAAAAATGTAEKPEPAEKPGRAEQSDPTAVDAGKTAAAPSPAAPGWTGARGTPT
ncbi:reverse transcriptase-like protein, partial [Mycobacterium avium]